jgi:predicted amidohydrolase
LATHFHGHNASVLIIAAAQSISVPGDIPLNIARHLRFAAIAAERGVRLLVFPELSLTGYEPSIARANAIGTGSAHLDPLRRAAEAARMTVVVGAPVLGASDELLIGALIFSADGALSIHTKEYLHAGEEAVFAAGSGGPLLPIEDANVALAICADTTHPEHAARAAARRASVYAAGVLITESGYAPDTAQLTAYAREHRMAVLMANHGAVTGGWEPAGKSAIWSEDGAIVAAASGVGEALIIGRKQGGVWDGAVPQVV